jgi:hypothetical protein
VCGHGFGEAEEDKSLIDQVGTEVLQQPGAGIGPFLPCPLLYEVAVSVPVCLVVNQAAKQTFPQKLLYRKEISVPPPVLKHGEHSPDTPGQPDQFFRLCGGLRERFFDNNVFAGLEALLCQGVV